MNLIKKIFLAVGFIALLGSCKKKDIPPTQYINYYVDGIFKNNEAEAYTFSDNTLIIGTADRKDDISIFIDTIAVTGIYPIGKSNAKVSTYSRDKIS
jgi:hypothetical protein